MSNEVQPNKVTQDSNQPHETIPGDAWSAAWSYDRLLLLQPHIRTSGLWKLGERFYAVCPDLDSGLIAKDGKPLSKWFDENRAMVCPIFLASSIPDGALRIPEHSAADLASLHGDPLTVHEVNAQLSILLPKGFPDFSFNTMLRIAYLYVARTLSHEETLTAHSVVRPFVVKFHFPIEIVVAPERFVRPEPVPEKDYRPHESQGISLVPARWLPGFLARPIIHAVEQDDEFWASHHVEVLSGSSTDPGSWLGPSFQMDGPKCLIDASVLPPRNIRTSLALFQQVALVAPLKDHHESALKGLAVTEDDLVQLAHRGRVRVLFPHAINRYSSTFIEKLCELNNTPFILSRRLAAAIVADSRRRMPLLHPPVGVAGRRALLEALQTMEDTSPEPWRQALIQGLGESWLSAEHALNFSGAMATAKIGIGRILGEMVKRQTDRDLLLEFLFTSTHVSWAGALGASIIPPNVEGRDGEWFQKMTEFCASSYSGAAPNASLVSIGSVEPLVEGLLALEGDISVLELDDAFSPQDVAQLSDLILGLAKVNSSPKDIRKIVRDMNDKIRAFQKRTKTLESLNLLAPAGTVAGYALGASRAGTALIGLGSWLLALVFKGLDPGQIPNGEMLDWVRGVNALTTPDVVLVSRLRKAIKDI